MKIHFPAGQQLSISLKKTGDVDFIVGGLIQMYGNATLSVMCLQSLCLREASIEHISLDVFSTLCVFNTLSNRYEMASDPETTEICERRGSRLFSFAFNSSVVSRTFQSLQCYITHFQCSAIVYIHEDYARSPFFLSPTSTLPFDSHSFPFPFDQGRAKLVQNCRE